MNGQTFTPLVGSVDIIAHEAGHAVLESEVALAFDPAESPTAPQQGVLDHASFADAAAATVAAAQSLYGATSTQAAAVTQAWSSVGVTPSTKLRSDQ